jgi:hypothetical protein
MLGCRCNTISPEKDSGVQRIQLRCMRDRAIFISAESQSVFARVQIKPTAKYWLQKKIATCSRRLIFDQVAKGLPE